MNDIDGIDLKSLIQSRLPLITAMGDNETENIRRIAATMAGCLSRGGTVYSCGNGGSASQSEHFSAELVGRFYQDRPSLPVYSLSENGAVLSSLANDYQFDHVFSHQIEGVGKEGDCLLALSTSGNSPNVVRACRVARDKGMHVFALTGEGGGQVAAFCDLTILVPDTNTARIQEMHLLVIHLICQLVEIALFSPVEPTPENNPT
jgi:D-sedoheptulose 7-phosphate isomerase